MANVLPQQFFSDQYNGSHDPYFYPRSPVAVRNTWFCKQESSLWKNRIQGILVENTTKGEENQSEICRDVSKEKDRKRDLRCLFFFSFFLIIIVLLRRCVACSPSDPLFFLPLPLFFSGLALLLISCADACPLFPVVNIQSLAITDGHARIPPIHPGVGTAATALSSAQERCLYSIFVFSFHYIFLSRGSDPPVWTFQCSETKAKADEYILCWGELA